MREIAVEVLSDGRFHPRRHISAEIRARGLKPTNLDTALKGERFERNRTVTGNPAYRDRDAYAQREPNPPARAEGQRKKASFDAGGSNGARNGSGMHVLGSLGDSGGAG